MNDAEEVVILVDASDRQIGTQAKLAAHVEGNMHRAISIFCSMPMATCCCNVALPRSTTPV